MRRIQAIVEAYSENPQRPSWNLAKYFTGQVRAEDNICPKLRADAARRAKEDRELQTRISAGGGSGGVVDIQIVGDDGVAAAGHGARGRGGKGGKKGERARGLPAGGK